MSGKKKNHGVLYKLSIWKDNMCDVREMAIPQRRFVLVQHTFLLIFVLIALYGYTSSSVNKFIFSTITTTKELFYPTFFSETFRSLLLALFLFCIAIVHFIQSPLGAFRNIWEQIWIGEALHCCLANPPIFSKGRKPEQTGIALDHVGSRASHGRVTQGRNSCVLFPIPRLFFSFP